MPRSVVRKDGVRYHLVIAELSNPAIVHFALQPEFNVRTKLIDSIVKQSEKYDGIQIDFESVPDEDKSLFVSFLKEIKKGIGKKILSIAVPARTRFVDDAFNYEPIVAVADRLIIMAYDEHWKTSAPGPVASLEWCEKVAGYVKTKIPSDKLVMGIPLYGRSWQRSRYDKEINYSDAKKITAANKKGAVRKDAKNPSLEYEQRVRVVVYFENATSIMKKVKLYRKNGIDSVAFWRMGQGPSEIWPLLKKDSDLKGTQAKK